MLTKLSTEGHPPAKKLVSGNQHGRLALLTSRTVGSNHELNAKHDGAAGERNSVAAFATGTVVGLHPSLILHHQQQQQQHALPPPPLRSKVKTSNGHLIPYMQQQVAHHSVKSRGPFQLLITELVPFSYHYLTTDGWKRNGIENEMPFTKDIDVQNSTRFLIHSSNRVSFFFLLFRLEFIILDLSRNEERIR